MVNDTWEVTSVINVHASKRCPQELGDVITLGFQSTVLLHLNLCWFLVMSQGLCAMYYAGRICSCWWPFVILIPNFHLSCVDLLEPRIAIVARDMNISKVLAPRNLHLKGQSNFELYAVPVVLGLAILSAVPWEVLVWSFVHYNHRQVQSF